MSRTDAYYDLPRTQDGRSRTLALTSAGNRLLADDLAPDAADGFTTKQLAAIRAAGYDVFLVDLGVLLGGAP